MAELHEFEAGYLTIATGQRRYFDMACNLAKSIKLRDQKRRVCLALDRELDIDEEDIRFFDDFYIFESGTRTGVEHKLMAMEYSPYKKTMFVDADILMIKTDIDYFWRQLNSKPFSFAGNIRRGGQWRIDIDKALNDLQIPWCASGNLGVFYFEKIDLGYQLFETAKRLMSQGDKYSVLHREDQGLSIEPILGLACGLHGIAPYPVTDDEGNEWHLTTIKGDKYDCDFNAGRAKFEKKGKPANPTFLHFPGLTLDGSSRKSRLYLSLVKQINSALAERS